MLSSFPEGILKPNAYFFQNTHGSVGFLGDEAAASFFGDGLEAFMDFVTNLV